MREGRNPAKDQTIENDAYHRVIIPVYVPNLEGYFANGLTVTKWCLESLITTKHTKAKITVVNNASCEEVTSYLQELYVAKKIDQLILHNQNVGKIDAIIPVAKQAQEPFVTLSDADVLFTTGWMQAVEQTFVAFPEAGMVAPVPNPTFYRVYSESTLFDGLLKRKLSFKSVCNPEDLLRFAKSIGSDTMYKKESRLKEQLVVERKGIQAVVGCGHFVATLRKEVFDKAPNSKSNMAYASSADRDYIDIPNDKAGGWRLATPKSFAYHIGNTPEMWMEAIFQNVKGSDETLATVPAFKRLGIPLSVKRTVNKLWLNRYLRPFFFKYLGLQEGRKEY